MNAHDEQNDHLLAAVAELGTHDVSDRHARRLRARCHAVLQAPSRREAPARRARVTLVRRIIGPALAGAWCLAYLVEIVRRAAAVYGF